MMVRQAGKVVERGGAMKHKAALWVFTVGLLVLFAGADGFSQTYPLPQPSDQTPSATYAGLPAVGFSPPIKRFVGRFLDSSASGDKTVPVRTYRNRSAGVYLEGDRIFVSMSSVFGAYKASTFFTQELGRGLDVKTWGASLPFAFSVDPEARNSGWVVDPIHAQDSMSGAVDGGGFDWDDRGNVVIGYKGWGWGIVDSSGRLIKQVKNGQVNSKILTARGASGYYVFSASASAFTGTEVFNVTTPATPALLRKLSLTFSSAAKSSMAPNAPVALLNGSLSIFTPDALAAGGPALQVFAGPYRMVTSDGTNFYAVRQTPTSSISKISPSSTGYVETTYPIAGSFQPSGVLYGAGYLTVFGSDMDEGRFGYSLRLYRLEAGVPKEIDLKNFLMRYYGTPPPGYTKPDSYTYPFEGHVVRYQSKDYLLVVAGGLSDVYELESGPAIPVAPDPEITVSGCVYAGDPCTLTAGSKSGASTSAWTFLWTVDGVTSGTVKTITPAFAVARTYAVSVAATNTVGTTSAAKSVQVLLVPVCDVVPSGVTIESSCGTTCSKDTPITFTAKASTYALKPCDRYAWSFPDGTGGTTPTVTKTFGQIGEITATLIVSNVIGAQAAATLKVNIVALACPPPDNRLGIDFGGTSATCYAGGNCAVGETVSFSISRFSNVATANCHLITWTFPDGTTSNLREPTKAFMTAGSHAVTLSASAPGGSPASVTVTVPVGGGGTSEPPPPPPPTGCTVPAVYVDFTGNQGCSAVTANCKVGEVLSLSPSSLASLPSCLTYRWDVTPGSAVYSTMNASHTLGAAGTYTIKLTATGSGSTRTASMNVTVSGTGTTPPPPPPTGCPSTAPGRYVSIGYTGATSGCSGGAPCQKNETIAFRAESTFGYVFQSCDSFEWNFGDGSAVSREKDPSHTFTGNGPYTVRLTVTNSKGSMTTETVIQMAGTGAKKPENVNFTFTGSTRVGAPITFTASSTSEIPVTYSWDFNDSSPLESGASVTHTFTTAKTYNVALTASNDGGPAAPKIVQVRIDPSTRFSFLLPAVASLKNADGSKWLTDVQILNTNPSTQPLELSFTFNGNSQTKNASITAVTSIFENVVEQLLPGTNYSGAVTVSGDSPNVPQMWTRTYLASPTGIGTYGHFIPAVPLNTTQSVVTGPSTYFIPGVETSPNFRTNLQIVNPNATSIDITVEAFDEIGIRLGSFTDTVAPFALLQVRDLQVRIPRVADGKPFSLQLSNASGMNMVTYASVIDNKSNDPAYVAGVSALDAGSGAMKQQIVPGVGRIEQASGTWKSDITLFNPDARGIEMNLTYIDGAGARYEAKNLRLPSYGSMRLADVLTSEKFATKPTGATSGIIILDTPTDTGVAKFPIMYDRTYKDRVGQGTFGQGIGSFASAKANVLKDAPAYIIGVRNSSTYKTNVGVVSLAQGTTIIAISLLDAGNDNIVKTIELAPGQSVIAPSIVPELLGALDKGSLKVQVLLGGPVWAYASIVDRLTEDPEYVPAVPSK